MSADGILAAVLVVLAVVVAAYLLVALIFPERF